jgi:hypothetical protein
MRGEEWKMGRRSLQACKERREGRGEGGEGMRLPLIAVVDSHLVELALGHILVQVTDPEGNVVLGENLLGGGLCVCVGGI